MQSGPAVQRWGGPTVLGSILVVVGVGWFVLRELGWDALGAISDAGWPLFVIIPGVALMIASLIPNPPRGVGFAIAGTIVTVAGSVLVYQQATEHWESWAYAWALVGPGAAGLGMLVYGLIFRQRDLLTVGARLVAIAAAIFVAGYWFFETVFTTGRAPVELAEWWPALVIGAGLSALAAGLLSRGTRSGNPTIHPNTQGGIR